MIDIYRFIIGLCGSVAMILILSAIYKKISEHIINIVATIGIHSLGIYMISGLIFNILPYFVQDLKTINYFIVILESIIILLISLLISICLKKNKITNLLFLGGRN